MNHETFHSFMLEYFIAILAFSMVNGLCHWKCFNFDIQILIKMADSSENWLCLLSHINCELSTRLNEFIEHILCMKHSIQQKCLFALEICSLLFNLSLSLFEFFVDGFHINLHCCRLLKACRISVKICNLFEQESFSIVNHTHKKWGQRFRIAIAAVNLYALTALYVSEAKELNTIFRIANAALIWTL